MFWGEVLSAAEKHNRTSSIRTTQAATLLPHHIAMNTIREIEKINQQELERGIAGTPASWHAQYANSAWCYVGNLDHQLTEGDVLCIMSQFGEIEDIHLVREEDTGKSRGFGFVKYEDARSCVLAVDNFVGTQVLGRSIRVDHVEHYRLPKKLQEQEEELQRKQYAAAGHAYEGKELENKYNVSKGVDLFAPASPGEDSDSHDDDNKVDKEARKRRQEERRRKRQKKEERRREREMKRERKEEKKRRKRAHHHDEREKENSSDDNDEEKSSHEYKKQKHNKKKRKHDKESTVTHALPFSHPYLPRSLLQILFTTLVWTSQHEVMAWTFPLTRRLKIQSRQIGTSVLASRRSEAPVAVRDEIGCSPTLTVLLNQQESFFFDPLNLATDENFATYREAELKHGRVAMIGVVSCTASTIFKEIEKVNQEGNFQLILKSLFSPLAATPNNAPSGVKEVVVKVPIDLQQLLPVPSPIILLQDWTVWDYVRMIIVCGIIETFVWVQADPQDMPGDYQVGYLGVRDKGLHERSLVSELENGRLSMMVMLYYFALDLWSVIQLNLMEQLKTA